MNVLVVSDVWISPQNLARYLKQGEYVIEFRHDTHTMVLKARESGGEIFSVQSNLPTTQCFVENFFTNGCENDGDMRWTGTIGETKANIS